MVLVAPFKHTVHGNRLVFNGPCDRSRLKLKLKLKPGLNTPVLHIVGPEGMKR